MENRVKKHLCRVYSLSMDEVADLVEIGRDTVFESLGRLDRAFEDRDAGEVREIGHMLKGTLYNMGLDDVAELAKSLENEAKNGDLARAGAFFAEVRRELRGLERPA
jgi:HPt (histidine-containing phosphotransfer) domain-containing protein